MKLAQCLVKSFPMVQKAQQEVLCFGKSQCDKQNKTKKTPF
jgi:hypothetical protein